MTTGTLPGTSLAEQGETVIVDEAGEHPVDPFTDSHGVNVVPVADEDVVSLLGDIKKLLIEANHYLKIIAKRSGGGK